MLARVDNVEGVMVTLHRTYVTHDGHKAAVPTVKKLMPCALNGASAGGAIRLYPAEETLCVTEGIETALAVRMQSGYAVCAAISATGMAQVILPPIAQTVLICADHDRAGIEAAHALANRLLREGRQVKILLPPTPGTDWCDALRQAGSLLDKALAVTPLPPADQARSTPSPVHMGVPMRLPMHLKTHITHEIRRSL
jgi:putative DNA primase/helicase